MDLLSPVHLAVILVVALLLFGNRLPEVARSLGRSINEFKKGMQQVQDEFKDEPPAPKLDPPREHEQTVHHQREKPTEPTETKHD